MSKKSVIKLLQFYEIEIIGSAKNTNIKYPSDIDLQESISTDQTFDDIYNFFMNIFKKAKEDKRIYIIDFKCGFHDGRPVRWDYENLMKGFQMIGEYKLTFQQALSQMSTIKIDVISLERGQFVEYSNNYYFFFEKYNHKNTKDKEKKEIENALLRDFQKLMTDGKIYKALKRLYSYYRLKGIVNKLTQLERLFNSDIGKVSKMKSSLETIDLIINQTFRRPLKKDIINNLKLIQNHLPDYKNELNQIMKLSLIKMSPEINSLIKKLNEQIINDTKKWMTDNKFKIIIRD